MADEERKVVATTTFNRTRAEDQGTDKDHWDFVTELAGGETGEPSGPYPTVAKALGGFLTLQGFKEWVPGQVLPSLFSGFIQTDKKGDTYQILTYANV